MWRTIPYVLPTFALLFAVFGPVSGLPAVMLGLSAFGIFNVLGLLDLRQRSPRMAELECGPGYIDIKKAGSRNQRIHARDITGATTARTSTGVLLTLQHQKREHPITLELADDAMGEKVRHALGIGHGGFGVIAWRTRGEASQRSAIVGRILAAATAFITIGATLGISTEAGAVAGFLLAVIGIIGAILGLAGLSSSLTEPSVVMGADGLRLKTPRGWFALPYEAIHHVEDHTKSLFFVVPEPYRSVIVEQVRPWMGGPSESERRMMVSQITAAAQRARGMGPQKNDVSGRIDVLRRNGESPRDWLVRLDMAGQMLSAGSGYRGNSLDVEDLWAILEDPEAEADLRAAAARVLRHSPVPETRVRIDAALAAVRDESTSRRLRIAIRDDLDGASQELAYLDATERQPSARMQVDPYGRPIPGR
ncbi:MAG: hypothetical protein J0I07_41135 [Myxococcales bacterium]|nr:hypothetical protein [Myxococcales bacterium]